MITKLSYCKRIYSLRRIIIKKISIEKQELIEKLKYVLIFQNLNNSEIEKLTEICELHEYDEYETIIKQDEFSTFLYSIVKGKVDVRIEGEEENFFITSLKKGDIFGEASIFMDVKRTASIVAGGMVHIVRISRDKLIDFVNTLPAAGVKIFGFIIFSLLYKLKGANKDLVFEKESTVSAKDLERLKSFFPKALDDFVNK